LNEQTAAFFEPENFSDLCEKFAELLSNSTRREKLAGAARSVVKAYSWNTRMAGIMRVINISLNNR